MIGWRDVTIPLAANTNPLKQMIMKAKDFRKVILFMSNEWSNETAEKIFGKVMGQHFYNKWCSRHENFNHPDYATMSMFYEMEDSYMQVLLDYIGKNYNG
jgi:hypothetical protein